LIAPWSLESGRRKVVAVVLLQQLILFA
jgi:hypothetical protein